ncbi:MAG: twin-arginine translocase subunit TatC [Myxococcota bacterium]|jgi:sec-independent protein translocase protein TatC|nr:twin-arginine translocase subunit TatC [Deltaproteobacteria bacterium]MCP4244046.1 twin-arginine translocase subunit TatC [bacterium]MDP6076308.1 twin-arginine translocase subunit TatC [Myxococcota bacterium]MDP6244459.1 twin-arginine translocase subunit TatC [Myxococcota bacterium]MDP7074846.1 twin-arginine translocase subunit TatC [Myxococcota bacterium]
MDETRLPLTDHLAELRSRLFKCVLAWVIGVAAAWSFSEEIFGLLLRPAVEALGGGERPLQAIAPTEIFFTYLKCAVLAGFVLSLPVIFWQLWSFIAPGLYPNEKNAVVPFVCASTLLFTGGAVFGYTTVFPLMFQFLSSFDSEFVHSAWTMREVFALTTRLFLAFGVAFELPVLVFFLAVAGIVDAPTLLRGTPYAVLAVFVVAAILTPPDWVSQVFLAVPMVGLYLLGIGVAWIFGARARKTEKASERAPVPD